MTRPLLITTAPRRRRRHLTLVPPPRRRRRPSQAVSRLVTFGPALALPVWGWDQLHQPDHWAGLAIMVIISVAILPGLIVMALLFAPRSGPGLMPRRWRRSYRNWQKDRGIPREQQRSARIPDYMRRVTYSADRYRCTYCRRRFPVQMLNVDHYLPWSQGGMTVLWNLLTLCRDCNLTKSNYWHGVFYRPVQELDADGQVTADFGDEGLAAAILAAERIHRYNPVRWTRAAWALGA